MIQSEAKLHLFNGIHTEIQSFVQRIARIFQTHELNRYLDSISKEYLEQRISSTIFDCLRTYTDLNNTKEDTYLPNYLQAILNREVNKRHCKYVIESYDNYERSQKSLPYSFPRRFINRKQQQSYFQESEEQQNKNTQTHGSSFKLCSNKDNSYDSCSQGSRQKEEKPIKRKNFTKKNKQEISQYSNIFGIEAASNQYQVPISKINYWNKILFNTKRKRGRKPIDLQMQTRLCEWIIQQLKKGRYLTQKVIREKAKRLSTSVQFMASKGWLQKLFKRRPQIFKTYTKYRDALKQSKQVKKEDSLMQENIEEYFESVSPVNGCKERINETIKIEKNQK